MYEAVKRLYGTDVGKESEFLAHGQKSLLRANLSIGVVVIFGIAYTGKEDSIGLLAHLEGLFGEGVAHLIYGMCTTESLLEGHLVTKAVGHSLQDGHTLFHNLGTDTITGQYSNIQFHKCQLLYIIYICVILSLSKSPFP